MLALGVLLGGIQLRDLIRTILALIATVTLALSIGMAISAFARDRRKSESTAASVAALLWFGLPFLDQALHRGVPGWPTFLSIGLLSPASLYGAAIGSVTVGAQRLFWAGLACNLVEIAGLLAIATWKLANSWQDEVFGRANGQQDRSSLDQGQRRGSGSDRKRATLRVRSLNANPFSWLVARQRWRRVRIWCFLVAGCLGGGLGAWQLRSHGGFVSIWIVFTLAVWYLFIRILLMEEASRTFIHQRSSGALEMLLATPLSVVDVIRGQWLGLWRQFAAPSMLFLGITLAAGLSAASGLTPALFQIQPAELAWLLGAVAIMFVVDLMALGWVAMWLSLKCRRKADVTGSTLFRIMVLPDIGYWFLVVFASAFKPAGDPFLLQLGTWFLLGLATDVFFIVWSRWRLRRNFRLLATLEYMENGPGALWGRWLGQQYARWFRLSHSG